MQSACCTHHGLPSTFGDEPPTLYVSTATRSFVVVSSRCQYPLYHGLGLSHRMTVRRSGACVSIHVLREALWLVTSSSALDVDAMADNDSQVDRVLKESAANEQ